MTQKALDRITDKVLSYDPDAPSGPLKVIAGAPDRPLAINGIEINAYVLENETRVLSQQGFLTAIGRARKARAGQGAQKQGVDNLPTFLSAHNLKPFISRELEGSTSPILFRVPGSGTIAYGFRAELLPEVCEVYLRARDAGKLAKNQMHIADQADILIRGLAKVGIIALVDEATGYQQIREENALAAILERLIAKELNPWTRTFPFDFYQQICRLKKWPSVLAIKRPSVIGRYTNDIVYDRLAPGVLEELQRRNPVLPEKRRRQHKHHQWLTTDIGHPELQKHLWAVVALMKAASSWATFKQSLDRAFPKQGHTIPLALDNPNE